MRGHAYFGTVPKLMTVCTVPGCPNLTAGSRCDEHARDSDRRGRAYRRQRELVLVRDGQRCQAMVLGANPAECAGGLQAHHVLDVALGGTDEATNLVALCRTHNNQARRAKPPRWVRALERIGPPALRRRAATPAPPRPAAWPAPPWA